MPGEGREGGGGAAALLIHQWRGERKRETKKTKKKNLPKGGNMPKGGNRYSTGKGMGTLFRHRDKRGRERRGLGGGVEAASGSITDQ